MKLSMILLTVGFLSVSAKSLSQNVSFSGRNVSLETVFSSVKQQTGYLFLYTDRLLRAAKPVSVTAENLPLEKFLKEVFKNQPLEYKIEGKSIFIEAKPAVGEPAGRQGISGTEAPLTLVRGQVFDQDGQPLVGASISKKSGKVVTITDAAGRFTIDANVGDVLVISFVGFSTTTIKLTSATTAVALSPSSNDDKASRSRPVVTTGTVASADGQTGGLIITLARSSFKLDTSIIVVSTGYQTISKERSAGSFSKPDMTIVNNRSTSMNILQRLDGLIPGLTVNNAPSSSQNPFLVRGLSTIGIYGGTSRNPLYVVDGIAMDDLSSINPQDVADITVLKDATSASIWGARAANGVIVITTKKGHANEKLRINYDGFISLQGKPDFSAIHVLNSQQYIQAAKDVFDPVTYPWNTVSTYNPGNVNPLPPHELILYNQYRGIISAEQANKSLDSLANINNGSQIKNLWYRNATLMNHSIAVSGGGNSYSFYGSLAYTNMQSNRPGDKNNQYKVNLRQDMNFNKNIKLYLVSDLTNTITAAARSIDITPSFYPYQLFRDARGNNISMPYMQSFPDSSRIDFQNRSRINLDYNPLDELNYGYTKSDALMARLVAGLTVKLWKGLRFEGVYGYVKGSNKTTSYDDAKSYPVRTELLKFTSAPTASSTPVYYLPSTGGKYSLLDIAQRNWTVRNQLVFDQSWNNNVHQLTLLAGQEAQEQLVVGTGSTVRGYNELLQTYGPVDYKTLGTTGVTSPVVPSFGASTLHDDAFSKNEMQTRFTSFYANAAYTYLMKYSINGSWRIDRSNLFGLDRSAQNRPVWSVGGKWRMSQEDFMRGLTWVDNLALRATYGITGNSPAPGTASSFDILSGLNSPFYQGPGLSISTPANRKLTWESTKTINLGLDFSVLKNRLNGSVDVYQKKTRDLLGSVTENGFSGYPFMVGNFGTLENKGVELQLTSANIQKKDFRWTTMFTMGYNKNKITELTNTQPIVTGADQVAQQYLAGYPAFAVFAYDFAGLDNMGDPLVALADKTTTKARNATKPQDIQFAGTYQPIWSGGMSNLFSYKGFSLSINAIYNLGHVMRRNGYGLYTGRLTGGPGSFTGNINSDFENRWKKPGDEAFTNIPSYVSSSYVSGTRRDLNYYILGKENVVSASYIKLRDITLSYSLPRMLVNRIKTENITFRVQVSNLMLWKANHYGIDPEFQNAVTGFTTMPVNQGALTFGAHVTF
ncbi:SusC/RagA family TonB-linked outer membrane protein [Chitinophaga eiseniae]|uniref:SusC/RagA family TonB-linked outer membrane protein n=1 Tax=Chitinophaga eiseniae TaxID=634771 RepID=A0A847SLR6_9BACT|nr:SusC/RagA family TonB-linked outer membrane protein [Chitinophaga eiseniae]NLR80135.1 SusC/RagA family TonB-linked outer membrane protein [Chitinophaga eiseniae]